MNHREYFDQSAAKWDELTGEETLVRLQKIVAGLGIKPGARVLDVGTGTGVLLPLLLERESQVVALDFSWEMIKRANAKGYPIAYVQGDVQRLPLKDGSFDWVICNAVFPHFLDKFRALSEIRRVLREGGRMVICHTESRQAINELHRSIGGAVAYDTIPPDKEVQWMLREAGLDNTIMRNERDCYLVLACRN